MTIGRLHEKEIIINAIIGKKNLFVYGPRGVGKTYLAEYALETLKDNNILYSKDCTSLKRLLIGCLQSFYKQSVLNTQNTRELRKIFFEKVKKERPYLVFDHVANITSRYSSFVHTLTEYTNMLIISRTSYIRDIKDLAIVTTNFNKLGISPLDKKQSYMLIDHFMGCLKSRVSNPTYFREYVYLITNGNPSTIKEVCSFAKKDKYNISGKINFNLLNLDRKISEFESSLR